MEHTSQSGNTDTVAWYKQFWPWFIICLLGSVVCASLVTVTIAFRHADRPVEGDYHRQGLATEKSHVAELSAAALKLSADLHVDGEAFVLRWLNSETPLPEQLNLHILHPFDHKLDSSLSLAKNANGEYIGTLEDTMNGRRYFVLEDPEHRWKLKSVSTQISTKMVVQFGHAGRD